MTFAPSGLRVASPCDTNGINVSPGEDSMKTLSVREMRAALSHLDELVAEAGEVVVTRRGRPLARIVPIRPRGGMPSRAEFRATMPRMKIPSEVYVRQDRDER